MTSKVTFHKSVRGYLHILKDIPCEDASLSYNDPDGAYSIAVVCDGHGARPCMRSAYGSKRAAEIAMEDLKLFADAALGEAPEEGRLTLLEQLRYEKPRAEAIRRLATSIIAQWTEDVLASLEAEPLTEEEFALAGPYEQLYRAGERLTHVFGTTLIAALWLPGHLILLQQGDGRCDVFFADGRVEQPIPWDDRCFENVTTSLCDEDAAGSIRHCVISLDDSPVAACYLGSDGVEDSFAYDPMEGTHCFYRRLSRELLERTTEAFDGYLEGYLPEFSREGSGDDVSVAGIVDADALRPLMPTHLDMVERFRLMDERRVHEVRTNSMARKHSYLAAALSEQEDQLSALARQMLGQEELIQKLQSELADVERQTAELQEQDRSNAELHGMVEQQEEAADEDGFLKKLKQQQPGVVKAIKDGIANTQFRVKRETHLLERRAASLKQQMEEAQEKLTELRTQHEKQKEKLAADTAEFAAYDEEFRSHQEAVRTLTEQIEALGGGKLSGDSGGEDADPARNDAPQEEHP